MRNRRTSLNPTTTREVNPWLRFRVACVLGAFVVVFCALGYKAYSLQIDRGQVLSRIANKQYEHQQKEVGLRGAIFDRNMNALALGEESFSLAINPKKIPPDKKTWDASQLSKLTGIGYETALKRVRSSKYFVWVKRFLSAALRDKIQSAHLPGIIFRKEFKRSYPNRSLAANLIGFSGVDGRGLEGIEKSHDDILSGNAIERPVTRDARGKSLVFDASATGPTAGHDVTLTIDSFIQQRLEHVLQRADVKVHPKRGWIGGMVMDFKTGDILAAASLPTFDPNKFSNYSPHEWRNRVFLDTFEPGSTMKVFSMASALQGGFAYRGEAINCERGQLDIDGHVIHDSHPHDILETDQIISKSSNIGIAKLSFRMGRSYLYDRLVDFGFGRDTSLGVLGEPKGKLRTPKQWSRVDLATIAFGQGVSVTMTQLLRGLGAIANDGRIVEPRLIKAIDGKELPIERGKRVIRPAVASHMRRMMRKVVSDRGTARTAVVEHYSTGGKTGTAQVINPRTGRYGEGRWLASFLGLIPARKPQLGIFILVKEPLGDAYRGGQIAAPLFSQLSAEIAGHWGVESDLSESRYSIARPSRIGRSKNQLTEVTTETRQYKSHSASLSLYKSAQKGDSQISVNRLSGERMRVMPDFHGMGLRRSLGLAEEIGLDLSLDGRGWVFSQRPPAGTILSDNSTGRLTLRPGRELLSDSISPDSKFAD